MFSLENLLIHRKLKGPGWLEVKMPRMYIFLVGCKFGVKLVVIASLFSCVHGTLVWQFDYTSVPKCHFRFDRINAKHSFTDIRNAWSTRSARMPTLLFLMKNTRKYMHRLDLHAASQTSWLRWSSVLFSNY